MVAAVTEAESASIVLVGSFNPAILHPQWFAKHALIPEGEAETAKVAVVSPELTAVRFAWFTLQVMDRSFTVTTNDPSQFRALEECVSGIFRLLEFTPIVAMGLNSERHVRVPTEDIWTPLENKLAPHAIWTNVLPGPRSGASTLQTLSVAGKRPESSAEQLSVTIEPSHQFQPGLFLRTNEHYSFSDGGDAREPMRTLRKNWNDALAYSNCVTDNFMRMVN